MILVLTEHKDGKLKPITNELLVFAQRVAKEFNKPVAAVALGDNLGSVSDELKTKKIDRVLVGEHPSLAEYNPDSYVAALKEILASEKPFLVIAGHTTQGFDFAPRLAVALR